jgi:hypothetical protein
MIEFDDKMEERLVQLWSDIMERLKANDGHLHRPLMLIAIENAIREDLMTASNSTHIIALTETTAKIKEYINLDLLRDDVRWWVDDEPKQAAA